MRPKKRLGQHFLTSTHMAERIADSVPAAPGDHVLEIGPGRGALTVHLLKRFPRLHLVEVDRDMVRELTERLGPGEWVLHQEDILGFDLARAGCPVHVVGNLPYSIAALIIHRMLRSAAVASCTFMVQREVARRIMARPGTRQRGYLSVFCQFHGSPRLVARVPAGAFFPKPKVDSTVFQIATSPDQGPSLPRERRQDFFAMVERAFQQRRKTLANALSNGSDKDLWLGRIARAGLDPGVRPEALEVRDWLALFGKAAAP